MKKSKSASTPFLWAMGLVLTGVVAGCSGGDGGSGASGTANAQPGTLGVSLTDAPACGYDQVNVTVSRVRVHQTNTDNVNAAGWHDIVLNPPKRIITIPPKTMARSYRLGIYLCRQDTILRSVWYWCRTTAVLPLTIRLSSLEYKERRNLIRRVLCNPASSWSMSSMCHPGSGLICCWTSTPASPLW